MVMAHNVTKGEEHRTGYALMKEIIDCHEGTIHIDTEKGMGTSYRNHTPNLKKGEPCTK